MDTVIRWDDEHNGVEIQTNDEHFVIDAQPSRVMSWHDAVRLCQNTGQTLPTKNQLQLVSEHIDEINTLLKEHGGYILFGWHWSSDEYDEFCAWGIDVSNGNIYSYNRNNFGYVRAVSAIQN